MRSRLIKIDQRSSVPELGFSRIGCLLDEVEVGRRAALLLREQETYTTYTGLVYGPDGRTFSTFMFAARDDRERDEILGAAAEGWHYWDHRPPGDVRPLSELPEWAR